MQHVFRECRAVPCGAHASKTTYAVSGQPRDYRVHHRDGAAAADRYSKPAGILFHTSESDLWPLEAGFAQQLRRGSAFLGVSFESRWDGGRSLPITRAQLIAGRNLTYYLRLAVNEGLAVVLAELAKESFTGIGISCGGGMCNSRWRRST